MSDKGMKLLKQKSLNRWNATAAYAMLQIGCWGMYAIVLTFASNVLYAYGFSDSRISLLLGICAAISLVLQLALAELTSRCPRIKVWGLLVLLGAVMVFSNMVVRLTNVPDWLAIGCFGIACMLIQTLPSWTNAIGMDSIKRGSPANYSIARGMGSLGYSILAYITGMLVRGYGFRMVPTVAMMCASGLAIAAIWYHFAGERNLTDVEPVQRNGEKNTNFLTRYPKFTLFLLCSVALQYSHNLIGNFMYQIMLTKNGGPAEQGIASSICALVELPVMFFFPLLMRRMRCDKWVRLASICVGVKTVGILLSSTPYGVYIAQASQMVGYGLYTISSVNYAEMVVGRGESIRAQTYLGATCTVGNLLALSTGGVICQYLGAQAMVLAALVLAIAGGATILLTAEKTKDF